MAEMEKAKVEIMIPNEYKLEAEEFADFFESLDAGEKGDLLKAFGAMKFYDGILKSRRAG